jgi:hypothetical protein
MASSSTEFVCSLCGKSHAGVPTDTAYTLPDDVWAIPEPERSEKAKWTSDLCQLGERYFIRCLLEVPFLDQPGYYGWGAWAEVEWPSFERYLQFYEKDGKAEAPLPARLANDLPTYGGTLGMPVFVQFRTASERPGVLLPEEANHALATEVRNGMSYARFHEVLIARGVEL